MPPLTAQEYKSLERSLRREGCRDAIVVEKGTNAILDGEHRYGICQRYGIPFEVVEKDFPNKTAAKIWMVDNQLARRNLTPYARSVLALELEPLLAEQARERQAVGRRLKRPLNSAGCQSESRETRDEVAKRAGVSHDTIARVKLIRDEGTEEEKSRLMRPDCTLSINQVYRRVRRDQMRTETPPFPKRRFAVILADPPYEYEFTQAENRAVENHYPTMTLEAMKNLPIGEITDKDCVLLLWAPPPKLQEAITLLTAWAFSYRSGIVWVKDKIGMGYYARAQHEHLLIATKGNPPVPPPDKRPSSVIRAPRGRHSEKPEKVYELIEQMYPSFEKIELFARPTSRRAGWTYWGNEVDPSREGA